MCSRSVTGLPIIAPSSSASASPSTKDLDINVGVVKANRERYLLVDVREESEWEDVIENALKIPMGSILSRVRVMQEEWQGKEVVFYCGDGLRSSIVAREMAARGCNARNLAGGRSAWDEPAFSNFALTVVISHDWNDPERAASGTAMALNGMRAGIPTALCFMLDGTNLMVANVLQQKPLGAPPPTPDIVKSIAEFLKLGGTIFCCKTCLAAHKLKQEDMEPYVHVFSSPDLLRFSMNGKLMQF